MDLTNIHNEFTEEIIMNRHLKNWAIGIMACALTLNLTGYTVYAQETEEEINADQITDESEEEDSLKSNLALITGFDILDDDYFILNEKVPIDEIGFPDQLGVYLENSNISESINVSWQCNSYNDIDENEYVFTPLWDEEVYELSADIAGDVPEITVVIQSVDNEIEWIASEPVNLSESVMVTPSENDYTINTDGTLTGLSTIYLNGLSAEQKKNINLVIPYSVKGTAVTAIGDKAFSLWYNNKYSDCDFVGLDLSNATNLTLIGNDAFYNAKNITGDLIIPDSVTIIGNNAFRECTGLNGKLVLSADLLSVGTYAFSNCHFTGQLILPSKLEKIGDSAFRLSNAAVSFTGELIIPASVTIIEKIAFSGQQGITSVIFKSNNITALPDSVFRYCSNLTGTVIIPDSVQLMGANTFGDTGKITVYLPKRKDSTNDKFLSDNTFSASVNAIICNEDDYKFVYEKLKSTVKPLASYEIKVSFNTNGGDSIAPILRLYNRPFNMEKQADGQWLTTDYKFPKVEGKKWGLEPNADTPVTESTKVSQNILYAIDAFADPVIKFSADIDKVYDGQPVQLKVEASHPLAKPIGSAKDGDVVFYYTWSWNTINFSPAVLSGFDKNVYEFSDVRESRFAISCAVKIQTCVVNGTKATVIKTDIHDFVVYMHQADPVIHPLYDTRPQIIANGLPEIQLSEGDTPGTIAWDDGQTLKTGVHEYTWTYTPVENAVKSYNYKTVTGSVKLTGIEKGYSVDFGTPVHGSVILDKPYGAVQGEDLTITIIPDNGYKLYSAVLDGYDITNDITNNKYVIKDMQADHQLVIEFTLMNAADVESAIDKLPNISDKEVISQEDKNNILDAKLNYDEVGSEIKNDSKEKLYDAISKLDQVEINVPSDKVAVANRLYLLENMETEDTKALKDDNIKFTVDVKVTDKAIDDDVSQILNTVLQDAVINESFDISVVKKISGDNVNTEIPLTDLKEPIQLVFEVPSDLPSVEAGYVREFYIVRLHTSNGQTQADVLPNEAASSDIIVVSSDKFSTYVIAYKDVKKPASMPGGSGSHSTSYAVRFVSENGKIIGYISDIRAGGKINEPMKPTKSGYTFTGWYLDKECTQPWDFAKDTVKENLILYAGWEKIEPSQKNHVVIFNYLIDNEYHSESVSEGNIAAMPAKPFKEGYTFTGWYIDQDCTIPWDFDNRVYSDLTLFAGWQVNTEEYPFTDYKPNEQSSVHLEAEADKKELPEEPVKEGYIFKGWFVDEDCTIPWKPEDDFEEDLKLYPGWEKEADVKTEEPSEIKPTENKPAPKQNDSMLLMLSAAAAVIVAGTILYIKKRRKTNK
ncbi:InlB B-repeat-containing protein [Dielma fastidiosa]|uniref:InlB B-repeat-containing protein n=1 Tax=Dielma fastidiosa TaxID=1034346 RepID=A0AB35UM15_9FIRM|nr:InlB B-repeat-containing protein [Dielma fastidiosa]MDY5169222.1 InlB B-repeat-containing protein [Dielma fastidiosa]